jgi:hypothetical protein
MASASSSDVKLEIGHVLFIDVIGYSKLLITEQSEQLQKLKQIRIQLKIVVVLLAQVTQILRNRKVRPAAFLIGVIDYRIQPLFKICTYCRDHMSPGLHFGS